MKKSFFLIAIFVLTTACGNSEQSKSDKSDSMSKADIESPCEILSEAEIKNALSIPADASTTMEEKDRLYSLCKYKWEAVTFEGIVSIGKTKKTIDYPAEMYITMVRDVSKEEYEQAISVYDDSQNQDGIGEMATWSAKKRQVTFLSNDLLIHVHLRTSSDEAINKEQVIKISKLIDEKI